MNDAPSASLSCCMGPEPCIASSAGAGVSEEDSTLASRPSKVSYAALRADRGLLLEGNREKRPWLGNSAETGQAGSGTDQYLTSSSSSHSKSGNSSSSSNALVLAAGE